MAREASGREKAQERGGRDVAKFEASNTSTYEKAVLILVGAVASRLLQLRPRKLTSKAFGLLKNLPIVSNAVASKKTSVLRKVEDSVARSSLQAPLISHLPSEPTSQDRTLALLTQRSHRDVSATFGRSKLSGTVYLDPSSEHAQFLSCVYARMAHTNPLHSDCFPSVARLEREAVSMVSQSLLNAPDSAAGCVTSGGTESIFGAVLTARDSRSNTSRPNVVACNTAHAALTKACRFLGVELRTLPAPTKSNADSSTNREKPATASMIGATGTQLRRRMDRNTILVYASAPSYPHGTMDDIPSIASAAQSIGAHCHVDACLGGFILPFWREEALEDSASGVPPFDFSVRGVTSISIDTHKYGLSHKGSSILIFRNTELRKAHFSTVSSWPGGLYASPGFAGSRSGGLIAQTWASLVHTGLSVYRENALQIHSLKQRLVEGLEAIDELYVIGQPSMVVAFGSNTSWLDIFEVGDEMTRHGWLINALQRPDGLHFCITTVHSESTVDCLLSDLRSAIESLLSQRDIYSSSQNKSEGRAPIYGMASSLPDRTLVGEMLADTQDIMLQYS